MSLKYYRILVVMCFIIAEGMLIAKSFSLTKEPPVTVHIYSDVLSELNGVVKLLITETDKSSGKCAGWIIKDHPLTAITAKHCTTGSKSIQVVFFDGTKSKVVKITQEAKADLSIIQISPTNNVKVLSISKEMYLGENLRVIGHPEFDNWYVGSATLAGSQLIIDKLEGETVILECPTCYQGDSGGPVLNKDGQVVGTLVTISLSHPNEAAMIPIGEINGS